MGVVAIGPIELGRDAERCGERIRCVTGDSINSGFEERSESLNTSFCQPGFVAACSAVRMSNRIPAISHDLQISAIRNAVFDGGTEQGLGELLLPSAGGESGSVGGA